MRALKWVCLCWVLPGIALADAGGWTESGAALSAPAAGSTTARVATRPSESPFSFDLGVSTHFPLSFGVEAGVELPGRLLGQLHVGYLPGAYAGVINGAATRFGWYDEQEAQVVERVLRRSVLVRPAIGIRPAPSAGFELWLGYTRMRSRATVTGRELVDAGVVDRVPPGSEASAKGSLHAISFALAYRFLVGESGLIRASIAYTNVLGASIAVDSGHPAANREVSRRLEEIFESKVQTLELRLSVGLRL